MQFDLSSADVLLPFLQHLFLGGGDTIMLHADPGDWTLQWEQWCDDRGKFSTPAAPGSRTITTRSMHRLIQQRWADLLLIRSMGSNLVQFGPRTPCLRALGSGSANRAGLSTASTPSGPPSNTLSPSEYAFYSPRVVRRRLRTRIFLVFLKLHHRQR